MVVKKSSRKTAHPQPAVRTEVQDVQGRARLFVTYVDVWSVAKMVMWMSVFAFAVVFLVATGLWWLVDSLHVAASLEDSLNTIIGSESFTVSISPYVQYAQLVKPLAIGCGLAALVTAFVATVATAMFNVGVKLFGGIELIVSDAPTRT